MRCSHYGAPGMLYLLSGVCWLCVFSLSMRYCMQFFLVYAPYVSVQCDALYLSQSIFYSHSFLVYVLCVPQCPHCFAGSVNVTSVIKHFQQLWLWKSARRWTCFFLFCVSLGQRWCPHCAICFVGSGPQLPIWHQNPINCIPMYILNRADECIQYNLNRADEWTFSIVFPCTMYILNRAEEWTISNVFSCTLYILIVFPRTFSIVLRYTFLTSETSQMKKITVKNF